MEALNTVTNCLVRVFGSKPVAGSLLFMGGVALMGAYGSMLADYSGKDAQLAKQELEICYTTYNQKSWCNVVPSDECKELCKEDQRLYWENFAAGWAFGSGMLMSLGGLELLYLSLRTMARSSVHRMTNFFSRDHSVNEEPSSAVYGAQV